jgi:hypothetical protein
MGPTNPSHTNTDTAKSLSDRQFLYESGGYLNILPLPKLKPVPMMDPWREMAQQTPYIIPIQIQPKASQITNSFTKAVATSIFCCCPN